MKIVSAYLVSCNENFSDARRNPVEQDIRPAPESVSWRKFPCLETITLIKKMKRFPEIED
jgi:hypothetical protein